MRERGQRESNGHKREGSKRAKGARSSITLPIEKGQKGADARDS
jgi:hypothetical protein